MTSIILSVNFIIITSIIVWEIWEMQIYMRDINSEG